MIGSEVAAMVKRMRDRRTAGQWIEEFQRQGRNIWDRLPSETDLQFSLFTAYRDLGPGRTLRKAADELGRLSINGNVPGAITTASTTQSWPPRAAAFDQYMLEHQIDMAANSKDIEAANWKQRRERLREKRHALADVVLSRVYATITSDAFKIEINQLRTWADWALGLGDKSIDPAGMPAGGAKVIADALEEGDARGLFEPEEKSDDELWRVAKGGRNTAA
jgi:hypothetical protein